MPPDKERPSKKGAPTPSYRFIDLGAAADKLKRVVLEFSTSDAPTKLIPLVERDEKFTALEQAVTTASALLIDNRMPYTRADENLPPDLVTAIAQVESSSASYGKGGRSRPSASDMLEIAVDRVFRRREFRDYGHLKEFCLADLQWHIEDYLDHLPQKPT